MVSNIRDRRKRPYRFKKINAVIEPTRHDNSVKDGDKAKSNRSMERAWIGYAEKEHVSLAYALAWAANHDDEVTLYLYDKDAGIYPAKVRKITRANKGALSKCGQRKKH